MLTCFFLTKEIPHKMPPSTRRVAHVPSWVDENITITALSNHVIGDASDENETLQQQEDRPLVTSSSSVHINVNTLRFLMANRRNLATSRSQCGRRDDELRDLPAAPSACRESDAIVALEHAMAKADDARYYNNRCAGATGEIFREDEKEVPPRTSIHHDSSNHHHHQHHGSYRQPENPINAVSTYHTHARSSVADVHQLFSSPPPPLAAMAMAVSSSSSQQLPPGQQANNVNALEEGGSAHNHSTASTSPPPPPLFNTMDNNTMLSTQDLMLQLAARGAIRDSTLREFLKFTPTPLTALAMTTLNARNVLSSSPFGEDDEDDNMFDAVYGGGGGGFAKVSVTRQQSAAAAANSQQQQECCYGLPTIATNRTRPRWNSYLPLPPLLWWCLFCRGRVVLAVSLSMGPRKLLDDRQWVMPMMLSRIRGLQNKTSLRWQRTLTPTLRPSPP
ncbi:Hypothetical protein, putative [Bodo saltans]|uniref:Uncharacterized protein n=1 Tax=Bodo saltans TaxID=75058 RepID=A0A0S4IK98_BODSA|nr:Hypothetical protein, putative [Bodo saltans]|eukprot:CUF04911.1 Hypothetical protein, putative [Bodo saltans]